MGVNPYVNWLYTDLGDGVIIFQLYDIIKPGSVNWERVHVKFSRMKGFMQKLENCNYAVELGKQMKFSLVGIGGENIMQGNETLTLGEGVLFIKVLKLMNTGHNKKQKDARSKNG